MAQHTQGEWYVLNELVTDRHLCSCPFYEIACKGDVKWIARVSAGSLLKEGEAEANAKLIAAAPDLLKALQEILAITDRKHAAWDKAKSAIKKAIN